MKKKIYFSRIFQIISALVILASAGQSYGQKKSPLSPLGGPCDGFVRPNSHFSTMQYDAATCRCFVIITFHDNFTILPQSQYDDYPYGIDVAAFDVHNNDVINTNTNVEQISGFSNWQSYSPAGINPKAFPVSAGGYHYYGWQTTYNGVSQGGYVHSKDPNYIIPSSATLKFKVFLNFQNASSIKVQLRELDFHCRLNNDEDNWYSCWMDTTFTKPRFPLSLSADCPQVCSGQPFTKIHLIPNQNQTACHHWDWYAVKMPSSGNCPSINPFNPSDWVFQQHDGNELQTGNLDGTYCYAVVLTDNCYTYITTPIDVTYCPDPSSIGGITVSPVSPTGGSNLVDLTADSNAYYACGSWLSGTTHKTFTLPDLGYCINSVSWYIDSTGTPIGPFNTTPKNVWDVTAMNIRFSCPLTQCYKIYTIKADITYNCCIYGVTTPQTVPKTVRIVINSPTTVGKITSDHWNYCGTPCPVTPLPSTTTPVICYDRGTVLNYSGPCFKVDQWDSLSSIGWVKIVGAGHDAQWYTNNLRKNTSYEITVHNGICPSKISTPIQVRVKPKLSVSIKGCKVICPSYTCTLKSQTSYTPPGYNVLYLWYQDGDPMMPAQTNPTLNVSTPGNYALQVMDPVCGKDTLSNTITVCDAEISFVGQPCFCDKGTFTITAVANACLQGNCPSITYDWLHSDGSISHGATVTDGKVGTYTVTVKCTALPCPLCQISKSISITNCP